ncbi:MAG: hypothetical protein SGPRY_010995 [Prymnesium sp.]
MPWAAPMLTELCALSRGFKGHTAASELSLPSWLYGELAKSTPLPTYGPLTLLRPDFVGLRLQPPLLSPPSYTRKLAQLGMKASPSPLSPTALILHSRPSDVTTLPGWGEAVRVQDAMQQWALSLLSPPPQGGRVLDACAAPGGKTRGLLSLTSDVSQPPTRVTSLEVSPRKCEQMRAAFRKEGRVEVVCGDASEAGWWDGEMFDRVVADVPCSGTGIMRTRPEVKVHQTEESVAGLQKTQLAILASLWPLLRPGGELLYSTCSLISKENEDVVKEFMRDKQGRAVVKNPKMPANGSADYHRVRKYGVTIFPTSQHQGGFASLIKKTAL